MLEPHLNVLKSDYNNSLKSEADIDQAFCDITGLLQRISGTLAHTIFKRNLKPYWNKELSTFKFRKVNSYRAWDSAGRPRDPGNMLYVSYEVYYLY